jgi:hypothetical protein
MPSREEIRAAFEEEYDRADRHSEGITNGLDKVAALIERDEHHSAYSEILERYRETLAATVTTPEPSATDLRFRALLLAVEWTKHKQVTRRNLRAIAETFRKYLENGATDAD